jgi:hypothetical protein
MNGLVLGAKKGSGGGHPIPAHAQRKQFEKMQAEQSAKVCFYFLKFSFEIRIINRTKNI